MLCLRHTDIFKSEEMKKRQSLILALSLIFALCVCGANKTTQGPEPAEEAAPVGESVSEAKEAAEEIRGGPFGEQGASGGMEHIDKLVNTQGRKLVFRPLFPKMESRLSLVWEKYHVFSPAAELFLQGLREAVL